MKTKLIALVLCVLMLLNVIAMASCGLKSEDAPLDRPIRDSLPSSIESEENPSDDKDHPANTTKPNDPEKEEGTSSNDGTETSDTGKTEENPNNNQNNNPGGNPGTNPGGNPGTNPGGNPGTNPGGNPGTNPGGNPGTNPGGNPGTNPGGSLLPTRPVVEAELYYSFDEGLNGYWVSSCENDPTVATIPNTHEGYPVIGIAPHAFSGCLSLDTVTVGNSVKYIDEHAFDCCANLTSITMGSSVESIGAYAFYCCSSLTNVVLPDSVVSIGEEAFYSCSSLLTVTFGEGLECIESNAFSWCDKLIEVVNHSALSLEDWCGNYSFTDSEFFVIHDEMSRIDKVDGFLFYPFEGENYLVGYEGYAVILTLPEDYEGGSYIVYENAFSDCEMLISVTISEGVSEICSSAFMGCARLSEVIDLSSLDLANDEYSALSHVSNIHGGPSILQLLDNYVFYTYENVHYLVAYVGFEKDLILPESYRDSTYEINDYAFFNQESLNSVKISDGVTAIGQGAFEWNVSITEVEIGSNVTRIEADAFRGSSVEYFWIPAGVTHIGPNAFSSMGDFTIEIDEDNPIYHSDGNCLIETATYTLLAGGSNSTIPDDGSVKVIGDSAFYNINMLGDFVIPENVESIGKSAFGSCYELTSVVLPSTLLTVDDWAFHDCNDLTAVYFASDPDAFNEIALGIGNEILTNVTVYFYSEFQPIEQGNYWCYVYGVPTPWSDTVYPNPDFENPGLPEPEGGRLTYSFNESNGIYTVNGYEGTPTELVIPDYYDGYAVTGISSFAFDGCNTLTSVVIGDNVEYLEDGAFENCFALTSVYLGDSLVTIGEDAFYNCSALTELSLPESLTSIGQEAFYNCSSLTELVIPDFVTFMGQQAFSSCDSLTQVTIGSGLETIPQYAFAWCEKLSSIVIPGNVTTIETEAFYYCTALRNVTFEEGLQEIGISAFYGCIELTSLVFPDSLTSIGANAFASCNHLMSVTLGNGLESIDVGAFDDCYKLVEIINHSELDLQPGSFSYGNVACQALIIHEEDNSKIEAVDGYWFYASEDGNYLLGYAGDDSALVLPEDYREESYEIYPYAFYERDNLRSVVISDGVETIGDSAFYRCRGLLCVTLGSNVKYVGYDAFESCYRLIEVINLSSFDVEDWSSSQISTYALEIHDGQTKLDAVDGYLFYTYDNVNYLVGYVGSDTELILPEDYNGEAYEIYPYAFSLCYDITSVVIPDAVTAVGEYAFEGLYRLKSVTIGDGVEIIGKYAFSSCESLLDLTIGEGVERIGEYAFCYCYQLENVVIPNCVQRMDAGTFYSCFALESVTIGSEVRWIGAYAFEDCHNLNSAIFSNPQGWTADETELSATDLADTEIAANYLTSWERYAKVDWNRN